MGLISCEETEIDNVSEARVVVEALLHANQPINIYISKEILFKREENDTIFYLEGLDVTMSDDNGSFILNDDGKGNYSSIKLVDPDFIYTIDFTYNNHEIFFNKPQSQINQKITLRPNHLLKLSPEMEVALQIILKKQ